MHNKILEKSYDYLMRYESTEKGLLGDSAFCNLRIGREKSGFYDENRPRILMFGSFKSGKSTFVNALTGRKLAAVGPFEKTSWVARYWSSDEEFCHIEKKDGSIEEISISEFVKNTQADVYDKEYLSSIYRVDIGYKSDNCEVALIDTPGFGASEENELRAIESVGDADLIFYMVDVNKLGKMREQAIVNKIRESKIPMVCIATKYDDNIAEDIEYNQVKKMVARHTGFDVMDVYPVSVKNYLEGEDENYFETIVELCKQVQINKIEHRKAAQQANLFRQSNSILSLYQKLRGEINNILAKKGEFQNQFFHYQKIINDELSVFIKDYVRKTLYAEHKENIVQVIELSLEKEDTERNAILSRILPGNYLEEYMEKLSKKVTEKQYELWNEKISELAIEYKGMMLELLDNNKSFSNMSFSDIEEIRNIGHSEKSLRDNGVKWSLGVAGFASFYEAVLGANAASVLLAGAAFTTGLPLAAGGLILTSYLLKKKNTSDVTKSAIRGAVDKEITNFGNTVSDYCISRVEDHDREIFASYMSGLDTEIQMYFPSGNEYFKEIEDCDKIINELREFCSSIEFYDAATDTEISLREKNRKLEEECDGLLSEIIEIKKNHSDEIRDREEEINELVVDKSSLQSQIQDKNNDIDELSIDCKNKEIEISKLKTKKTELEEDKEKNEADIETLTRKINDKEFELKDKILEIRRLEKEKSEFEQSNSEKSAEINKLKKQKREQEEIYQKQISQKQDELEQKVEENSKLKEEIDDLKFQAPSFEGKAKLEQDICKKLDEFVHRGDNKLRLTTSDATEELMDGLENLILFTDEDLGFFIDDLRMILKNGISYKSEGLTIISLIDGKYVICREKKYKAYCLLEGNSFTVKCVDVWSKDADRYRRYKMQLTQAPILADDELKYRIFDEIKRAKKQIVIAVPWITQKAWEEKGNYKYSFEDVITNAINQNKDLKVYIITGNSGDISSKSSNISSINGKDKDEETQFMIEKIKSKFVKKSTQIVIYGDCIIHDKILVVDDRFRMVGSYNMLSNQGLYGNGYDRQGETMEINENPRNVKRTLAIASARANQGADYFCVGQN